MAFDYEALAVGLNEDNRRQTIVLESCMKRIAELEAALREMQKSVPGGTHCDPQEIADTLREIAEKVGVKIID